MIVIEFLHSAIARRVHYIQPQSFIAWLLRYIMLMMANFESPLLARQIFCVCAAKSLDRTFLRHFICV